MGKTVGGGNQNVDDWSVYISSTDLTTGVTFTRNGTANDCRVNWEIIQYTGVSGGDNEIIVRGLGTKAFTTLLQDTVSVSGVSTDSDLVPFITGQISSDTGRSNRHTGLFTASYSSGTITFDRGSNDVNGDVSYVAVEFVGANWTVATTEFTNSASPATITAVTLAKTFLHCQYRYANNTAACGLDDGGARITLSSATQLTASATSSTDSTLKYNRVWIISNSQTGTGEMGVQQYSEDNIAGSGEEEIGTFTVTSVTDMSNTSLLGETSNSTGGGTAWPRGAIVLELTAADTVTWKQSDNVQTSDIGFQVVQWPEAQGGGTTHQLEGSTDSTSLLSGSVETTSKHLLSGVTNSISLLSGTAILELSFAGRTDTISLLSGSIGITIPLSGNADSISLHSGTLITSTKQVLEGSIDTESLLSGGIILDIALQGSADTNSVLGGNLSVAGAVEMAGSTDSVSLLSGALSLYMPIAGSTDTISLLSATLELVKLFEGSTDTDSLLSGSLWVYYKHLLEGASDSISLLSGSLTVIKAKEILSYDIDTLENLIVSINNIETLAYNIDTAECNYTIDTAPGINYNIDIAETIEYDIVMR